MAKARTAPKAEKRSKRASRMMRIVPRLFPPTAASTRTEVLLIGDAPQIHITEIAWRTMRQYILSVETEIGWLGSVTQSGSTYTITEVFLVEQIVSGSETLMTEAGQNRLHAELLARTARNPLAARAFVDAERNSTSLGDVFSALLEEYGADLNIAIELGNTLRFWGHSHVNMHVRPSPSDDRQMEQYAESGYSFMIRGIINKRGELRFDLFDYARKHIVTNLVPTCAPETDMKEPDVAQEIAAKLTVTPEKYNTTTVGTVQEGTLLTDGELDSLYEAYCLDRNRLV